MTCVMTCVTMIKNEPKRMYSKSGKEISNFTGSVRRNGKDTGYDIFQFEAWEEKAKYINDYFHSGDLVSVVCRPQSQKYKRKDGTVLTFIKFRIIEINLIRHKRDAVTEISSFGGVDIPEL